MSTQSDHVRSQPVLESQRLVLRPLRMEDAEPMYSLVNDREIAANTRSIPYPYPEDGATRWIRGLDELWNEGKAANFATCIKPPGYPTDQQTELIGVVGLSIDRENENAELGYWIGQKYWNRGFCSEGCQVVVDFGFEFLGLNRIHAHHMNRNPASGRVMEKIGMSYEGLLKQHVKKWGLFEDIAMFGVTRDNWSDQKQGVNRPRLSR